MKTLKQIREEYNANFMSQEEFSPEEIMLEDKSAKSMLTVPSMKDMPSLLIFRRVSFRLYPNKQVVALYYSKLVDKYLSIPFGPTGNLNLSEAVVLDEEQLDEFIQAALPALAAGAEMLAGAGARAALTGGARAALGAAGRAAGVARGVAGRAVGAARGLNRRMDRSVLGRLVKRGIKNALSSKDDNNNSQHPEPQAEPTNKLIRNEPTGKSYSSWETAKSGKTIDQVRQRELLRKDAQASSKNVAENKILDIRTMIKEGVDNMDLSINGRTITLNTSMAKRILEVYDSVNTKNKKIVEGMLNEDLESFKKLLNFSIRN
jgi:hypothetical protein